LIRAAMRPGMGGQRNGKQPDGPTLDRSSGRRGSLHRYLYASRKAALRRHQGGPHQGQTFPGEAALLGNAFLAKSRVTIDESRCLVNLERVPANQSMEFDGQHAFDKWLFPPMWPRLRCFGRF